LAGFATLTRTEHRKKAMASETMAIKRPAPPSLSDYLTVRKAAQMLGVSVSTLRNWDRSGKLKPVRHPVNGYRLYRTEDLERLLRTVDQVEMDRPAQELSQKRVDHRSTEGHV
jgi:excisionase family DNA binding protein